MEIRFIPFFDLQLLRSSSCVRLVLEHDAGKDSSSHRFLGLLARQDCLEYRAFQAPLVDLQVRVDQVLLSWVAGRVVLACLERHSRLDFQVDQLVQVLPCRLVNRPAHDHLVALVVLDAQLLLLSPDLLKVKSFTDIVLITLKEEGVTWETW